MFGTTSQCTLLLSIGAAARTGVMILSTERYMYILLLVPILLAFFAAYYRHPRSAAALLKEDARPIDMLTSGGNGRRVVVVGHP